MHALERPGGQPPPRQEGATGGENGSFQGSFWGCSR